MRVSEKNILGKEGEGFKVALAILDGGRIGIAAQSLGIAEACLEAVSRLCKRQTTSLANQLQNSKAIAFKLADMATNIEAAKLLVYRAAELKGNGKALWKGSLNGKALRFENSGRSCDRSRSNFWGIWIYKRLSG